MNFTNILPVLFLQNFREFTLAVHGTIIDGFRQQIESMIADFLYIVFM